MLALAVLDLFSLCVAIAGPAGYGPLLTFGVLGLGCGAALGVYFSAKTKPPTAWSPYYGFIYGLAGMAITTFIIYFLLIKCFCG